MKKLLFAFTLVPLLIIVGCSNDHTEVESNMSEKVADFEFTTQDNDTLTRDDLKGKWWVADFIFTNCTTVCLPMSSNMSALQEKIKEEDIDNVQLVSFSVDPDFDTPDVLTEYAKNYEADHEMWTFLTGYEFDTIKELSIKSFRNLVQEAEPGSDQVMHGTRFFLVDPEGKVIKNYDGVKADEMDAIVEDLVALTK